MVVLVKLLDIAHHVVYKEKHVRSANETGFEMFSNFYGRHLENVRLIYAMFILERDINDLMKNYVVFRLLNSKVIVHVTCSVDTSFSNVYILTNCNCD